MQHPETIIDAIIDSFGLDLADRVMKSLGGVELRIPKRKQTLHDNHRLVLALGRDGAEKIVFLLGGEKVSIPSGKIDRRLSDILNGFEAGMSSAEIARSVGLSQRQIRRYRIRYAPTRPARAAAQVSPRKRPAPTPPARASFLTVS